MIVKFDKIIFLGNKLEYEIKGVFIILVVCHVFFFSSLIFFWNKMFPPGLEPGTFRVLGERDNRYTTETCVKIQIIAFIN